LSAVKNIKKVNKDARAVYPLIPNHKKIKIEETKKIKIFKWCALNSFSLKTTLVKNEREKKLKNKTVKNKLKNSKIELIKTFTSWKKIKRKHKKVIFKDVKNSKKATVCFFNFCI
jgi:hypothetical protein